MSCYSRTNARPWKYQKHLNDQIMTEYFICFYQDTKNLVDSSEDDLKNGDSLKVSEKQMFAWIEESHQNKVKISIYSASVICDLS